MLGCSAKGGSRDFAKTTEVNPDSQTNLVRTLVAQIEDTCATRWDTLVGVRECSFRAQMQR
jgi:hypothetical protein